MNHRTRFALQTVAYDLAAFLLAATAASQYVFREALLWRAPNYLTDFRSPEPMGLILLLGIVAGSWQSTTWIEPHVARPLYQRAFVAAAVGLGASLVGQFALRTYYSRSWVPLTIGGFLVLGLLHRAIRRRRPWRERMVVVTDEKALAHDLSESPHAEVIELLDPRGEPPAAALPTTTTLVVDLTSPMSDSMARYVSSSTLAGYDVRLLSEVYEEQFGRVALIHLAEGWEISVPLEQRAPYIPYKRVLETLLVIATAPLWLFLGLLTWIAIRADSKGPAIFRQTRTGINDRPFTIHKFRTMIAGADEGGPQFTAPDDPRITRIGRFLRVSKLDEIPQLWDVLRGELSLVGPRAEQTAFTSYFESMIPFYRYRHLVRPGITGWAQVHYGYADDVNDTIEKLQYDLYYVRHMSPLLDLIVMLKTIRTIFTGRGAQ